MLGNVHIISHSCDLTNLYLNNEFLHKFTTKTHHRTSPKLAAAIKKQKEITRHANDKEYGG